MKGKVVGPRDSLIHRVRRVKNLAFCALLTGSELNWQPYKDGPEVDISKKSLAIIEKYLSTL